VYERRCVNNYNVPERVAEDDRTARKRLEGVPEIPRGIGACT